MSRTCLDQLLIAIRSREGCAIMCDQQTWRSQSFQISQHLRQHLTSFTRHCAKTDHAESTHCGGSLQMYGISISRHCAQCVDSLCCYLDDSTTAPAANIWSHQRDRQRWVSRESGSISVSNGRTLRACVPLSDYRQQLQTIPPGLSAV